MANTILTDEVIAKEALRLLENNLVFARGVNRTYEKTFEGERKVGDTINVKKPSMYTVRSGATASVQDNLQETVPVVVDSQKGVDVAFTSKELALDLQDFSDEVLKPQMAVLSNQVDLDGLSLYKKVPRIVHGTLANFDTYLSAGAGLDEEAAPMDDQRNLILNPRAQVQVVNGLKGLFQSSSQIKDQYEKGRMGTAAGFDWMMSQNLPTHTVGAHGGTPVTAAVGAAGGTSIATSGWTASTAVLKEGDVFTIAGVNAVNPMSKQSTGQLRQFVVTADMTSGGTGLGTVSFYPATIATGALQNVTALPANGAAITVVGTSATAFAQNLAFHKDAFTLVTVDLPLPKGMDMSARASSKKAGLSVRIVRGYDITNDKFISRIDVLYGWKCIRPELAVRISGT